MTLLQIVSVYTPYPVWITDCAPVVADFVDARCLCRYSLYDAIEANDGAWNECLRSSQTVNVAPALNPFLTCPPSHSLHFHRQD